MEWAIACDFDGTAVLQDIGDAVAIHFGGRDNWQRAEDEYAAGAISFQRLLERLFQPITAGRDEITAFARATASWRPGFPRFVAACREAGRPLHVVSAGLDVYIEPVLDLLPAEARAHLELRCNRAHCSPSGMTIEFPGLGLGCGQCGTCKRTPVEALRAGGRRVAFVGDGVSDLCGAEIADAAFARGSLVRRLAARGKGHLPYDDFDEVMASFPGGWDG
jgi:2-hydroxy-3-keto-5-methylthiopentenyl-1-phosphate phosphatase